MREKREVYGQYLQGGSAKTGRSMRKKQQVKKKIQEQKKNRASRRWDKKALVNFKKENILERAE